MLTNDNYFVVQGYMRTELGLKGNELMVYAIINGFSQTEEQRFTGSLSYLAEFTGATKRTVISSLKALVDKDLLEKFDTEKNGVHRTEYAVKNFHRCKIFTEVVKNFHRGGEKISPNNKEDNKEINKNSIAVLNNKSLELNTDINISLDNEVNTDTNLITKTIIGEPSKPKKTKKASVPKKKYGDFQRVKLTDEEYGKLCADYGEKATANAIAYLDAYIEEKGYKAKSHYLALKRWVYDALHERNARRGKADPLSSYRYDWIDEITL